MKKTILALYFMDGYNPKVDGKTTRFVYRHCSNISAHKLKRLAKRLNISFDKLLVTVFAKLVAGYIGCEAIRIGNQMNGDEVSLWECKIDGDSFSKTLSQSALKKKSKNLFWGLEALAVNFEIKIVKQKILFSYYYPEDFVSEIFSTQMVYDFEKLMRELLRHYEI